MVQLPMTYLEPVKNSVSMNCPEQLSLPVHPRALEKRLPTQTVSARFSLPVIRTDELGNSNAPNWSRMLPMKDVTLLINALELSLFPAGKKNSPQGSHM